jgi:hypothetical protein
MYSNTAKASTTACTSPLPTASITSSVSKYWFWWRITLGWATKNAVSASISSIGNVVLVGNKTLTVTKKGTYTYTLTARSASGATATATTKVVVQ